MAEVLFDHWLLNGHQLVARYFYQGYSPPATQIRWWAQRRGIGSTAMLAKSSLLIDTQEFVVAS